MRCSDFMARTSLWRRFSDFRHVTSFKTRVPSVSLTLWRVSREHIFTPKTLEQSELGQEEPFSSGEIICCNYENTWAADITARGRKKRKKNFTKTRRTNVLLSHSSSFRIVTHQPSQTFMGARKPCGILQVNYQCHIQFASWKKVNFDVGGKKGT